MIGPDLKFLACTSRLTGEPGIIDPKEGQEGAGNSLNNQVLEYLDMFQRGSTITKSKRAGTVEFYPFRIYLHPEYKKF